MNHNRPNVVELTKELSTRDLISMTDLEKDYVRRIVNMEQDDLKKKLLRKEFVEFFNVSVSQISAITAWSKIWENPPSLMYENDTKRAWRKQIRDDIAEIFPGDRSNLRVLCFPGEMGIEVEEIWHPLGITDVVGVEREKSRVFMHSGKRLGFRGYIGDLETLLKKQSLPTEYDIVCLDYLGPVHVGMFNCLQYIKMRTDKFCLIENVMGRREREDVKTLLEQDAIISDCTLDEYLRRRRDGCLENKKGISLLRDKISCISYHMSLYDTLVETGKITTTSEEVFAFSRVLEMLSTIISYNFNITDNASQGAFEALFSISFLSPDYDIPQVSLKDVHSYFYKSEDGGAKFFTDILEIKKEPRGEVKFMQRIRRFLWDCVREVQSCSRPDEIYAHFQKGSKLRKWEPELQICFNHKKITLPWKFLPLAEREADMVIKKCLARRYYSDSWEGVERKEIIST